MVDGATSGQHDPVHPPVPKPLSSEDAAEARGLRFAMWALIGMIGRIVLPPLRREPRCATRRPTTIIGNTPFMASLIFIITLIFLVCGIAYGMGAKTVQVER